MDANQHRACWWQEIGSLLVWSPKDISKSQQGNLIVAWLMPVVYSLPILPHMLPRMVFLHPGIYNTANAVWLKGRSKKECVHNARWKQKNAGYKLPVKWRWLQAAQLAICVPALLLWLPRSEHTHIASVLKEAFLCYCNMKQKNPNNPIHPENMHWLVANKRGPHYSVGVTTVKTTAKNGTRTK